jgi:polar amino acid transport system substrate-binding protein
MNHRFKSLFFAAISIASIGIDRDFVIAGTLKEIQQRRKLVVAVKDNLPPLGFRKDGNLQGLEIDIARRLATDILGEKGTIELKPVVNQDRLKVVIEGTVDIAIAKVTITSTRSRVVDFSRYYYLDGTGIITDRRTIVIDSHLRGKKIAVLNNSTTISTLQYMMPRSQLVGVNSYQEARDLLAAQKVVAIAADRSMLIGWRKTYPYYHLVSTKLSSEALGIVMPKGMQYQPLRDLVDRSIDRWYAEGWLQQRIQYWGLE